MNKETITINGLMDGISVIEKDNKQETSHIPSDVLYNENEPITICSFEEIIYDNN
jgi:hypothetical protein